MTELHRHNDELAEIREMLCFIIDTQNDILDALDEMAQAGLDEAKIKAVSKAIKLKTAKLKAAVKANQVTPRPKKESPMKAGSSSVDTLVADVAAENTVIDSAIALINGFSTRLADGIAAARAGDFAALDALDADVKAKTQQLADAVQQNTPVTAKKSKP